MDCYVFGAEWFVERVVHLWKVIYSEKVISRSCKLFKDSNERSDKFTKFTEELRVILYDAQKRTMKMKTKW